MTAEGTRALISVDDLVVGFGDRTVLKGLSLDVRQGEILGIAGGSGSGKSVLMRAIIGLVPKRAGTIMLFGRNADMLDDAERRAVGKRWGILFQHGALFSSLSVLENVQFPMREAWQLSERCMEEVAITKLAMVGLDARDAAKFPAELSGGMTKRVALARALALEPELVFLDEPTSGLDPISAAEFDDLIATLQKTLGLTVFMVTHDLASLETVCDRIVVLADGQVAACGPLPEIMRSEHPWVKAYFRGKRGQAIARPSATAAN